MRHILQIILILSFSSSFGQKILRPNSKIVEPTLDEFIIEFKKAVGEKDKKYVIENLSPQIQNSFGGDGGIEEFKEYWAWDEENSPFWGLMTKLFQLGGGIFEEGESYLIPYVFSDWPGHEKYDVFEHMVITGSNVNVRDQPTSLDSKILGKLDYDIVKVNYEKSYPPFSAPKIDKVSYVGEKLWYFIESLDGKLTGYVYWDYIWSPIGYRAAFYKIDGKWQMTFLLAGD